MYKRVAVWLSLFLALAGGTAQAITMVSVNANNVNMRSGPGEKYAVLWELGTGFPLKVLDEQGDWYKVEDFEGDVGWIYKTLVGRDPHLIVKKKRVNMRSGPGDGYRVLGKANYGVVFKTLKVKDGWARVKHENGLTGWVSRTLLWGW
jgi:SH3-like domain-containing protein